jgi:hypothetical protein
MPIVYRRSVSGHRMIMMMQPTTILSCITMLACFAGNANALIYYPKGLCLQEATETGGSLSCTANEVSAVVANTTGAPKCTLGQNISVSININITMSTGANRYDLGAYLASMGLMPNLVHRKMHVLCNIWEMTQSQLQEVYRN